MKVCFIADGRSPIARSWVVYLASRGVEVHLVSSYPCDPGELPGVRVYTVPLAFGGLLGGDARSADTPGPAGRTLRFLIRPAIALRSTPLMTSVRYWLGSAEIFRHVGRIRRLVERIGPDLVHAMRIPFEGIVASMAVPRGVPLLISVWGIDFTLFASSIPPVGWLTRRAMRRADALHCDCHRDLRLAYEWGFDRARPAVVLPGSGGVDPAVFRSCI